MDVYVITDDPCLEQYEFSLYKEKGKGAARDADDRSVGEVALPDVTSILMRIAVPFLTLTVLSLSTDERDAIQKKTFTKWINKHLVKVSREFRHPCLHNLVL